MCYVHVYVHCMYGTCNTFHCIVIDNGEVIVQVCCTSITKPLDFNWLKLDNTPISTNSSTSETLVIPEFNSLTDEDVYFCLSGNGINVSMYALKIRVRNSKFI